MRCGVRRRSIPDRIELSVLHLWTHGPLRSRYERLRVRMTHVPIPNLHSPRTALQRMRLAGLLRRWDVVHSHDIYSNIFVVPWSRILTRCSVIASRRWWYDVPRPELSKLNRWSSLLAHRVLANSSGVAELLAREEAVASSKFVEIPNFLAPNAFEALDEPLRVAQRPAWRTSRWGICHRNRRPAGAGEEPHPAPKGTLTARYPLPLGRHWRWLVPG